MNRETVSPPPIRPSRLLAIWRTLGLIAMTVGGLPVLKTIMGIWPSTISWVPRAWHSRCCKIMGIHIDVHGEMADQGRVLFVSNHVSYLDISILGSLIHGSFVSKKEVDDWPIFGMLARLQKTVFIAREAGEARRQLKEMEQRLVGGDNLILFPEGTSSDGTFTLPFKSALFAAAGTEIDGRKIQVQPVSIAYARLDGVPMGRWLRPFYAWYGEMTLLPHFWRLLGLGRVGVDIVFHPPVSLDEIGSRKALAEHCGAAVADGVARALSGRLRPGARAEALGDEDFDVRPMEDAA